MRLKSRAGASGSARSPSHSASTDSSSPRRNSSTSTGWSPNCRCSIIATSALWAYALVLGDHDALAGRQAVGLDHRRVGGDRRHPLLDGADDPVPGGRHPGRLHDLLGERLRALEPRRLALGPEHRDALGLELVGEARDQRRLGSHHDQVGARLRRGSRERDRVAGVGGEPLRLGADAGVAGRAPQLGLLRRAGQRADQTRAHGHRRRRRGPSSARRVADAPDRLQSDAMKSSIGIAASDS